MGHHWAWELQEAVDKALRQKCLDLLILIYNLTLFVNSVFEGLAGRKLHGFCSSNFDGLAGARIAASARGALAGTKGSKADQLHGVSFGDCFDNSGNHGADNFISL